MSRGRNLALGECDFYLGPNVVWTGRRVLYPRSSYEGSAMSWPSQARPSAYARHTIGDAW